MPQPHVAAVVLNYNSERDLAECVDRLCAQQGVRLSIVLVDNASCSESRAALNAWLAEHHPAVMAGSEAEVSRTAAECRADGLLYLIKNESNLGYSAGNNCGIRLALKLGADAVLIVNPDVRIEDPSYLAALAGHLLADANSAVAGSRIMGLDGFEQSPLREPTFLEELLWPRALLRRWRPTPSYILPITAAEPLTVPKVSGCCLMLGRRFLLATGGFDEGVFLYCEEPILAAQVRARGMRILFVPGLHALHAHVAAAKGDPSRRMLRFIESRRYYLTRYAGLSWWRHCLLTGSYALLAAYYRWASTRRS